MFKFDCSKFAAYPDERLKCEALSTFANGTGRFFVNMTKTVQSQGNAFEVDGRNSFPILDAAELQVGFVFGKDQGKQL